VHHRQACTARWACTAAPLWAGCYGWSRTCYLTCVLAAQPPAELPRRAALLRPLQGLVLPKRWGRDAMYAALQAALDALQVSAVGLRVHSS
jgi:hypothetical protein